jgi:hypothetical protein
MPRWILAVAACALMTGSVALLAQTAQPQSSAPSHTALTFEGDTARVDRGRQIGEDGGL